MLASVAILVSGGGMQLDMVTLGGARPKVIVVPELVALVANLWPFSSNRTDIYAKHPRCFEKVQL